MIVEMGATLLYTQRMEKRIRKVASLTGQQRHSTACNRQQTLYSTMPIDFPQYAYKNTEVGGRMQGSERFTKQPFSMEIIITSFVLFNK